MLAFYLDRIWSICVDCWSIDIDFSMGIFDNLTIINKIQSNTVMNTLLDSIEKGIKKNNEAKLSDQR